MLCDLSVMRGKLLPVALDPTPITMKDISDMQGMYVCVFICVLVVISLKPWFGFQNKLLTKDRLLINLTIFYLIGY